MTNLSVTFGLLLVVTLSWLFRGIWPVFKKWSAFSKLPRPKGIFLLGNVKELVDFKNYWNSCNSLQKYGGICGYRLGYFWFAAVGDPVFAHEVMQISDVADKGWAYRPFERLLTKQVSSIFTSPTNAYWKGIRKGVAPAFNGGNLKQGFSRLQELMPKVVEHAMQLGPGKGLNIIAVAGRVTMDSISLSIFGRTMGCTDELASNTQPEVARNAAEATDAVIATVSAPWLLRLSWIPAVRRANKAIKQMHAQNRELVRELRGCKPAATTLGAHLLALKDPATGKSLDDFQLEAELSTFFTAGYETSTTATGWALYCIATQPEVQQGIAAELQECGLLASPSQPQPRRLDWEDLGGLQYLRNVIKESMRLYPVASGGTLRVLKKDTTLGGYHLLAGTSIAVQFYAIHRNPKYWDRPEEFLPERWDVPNAEYVQSTPLVPDTPSQKGKAAHSMDGHTPPPGMNGRVSVPRQSEGIHAEELWQADQSTKAAAQAAGGTKDCSSIRRFMPFSVGLRNCVGQNLANTTVQTIVATICSHFLVELAPEMEGPEGVAKRTTLTLTLHVDGGLWLRLTPRIHA